MSPQSMREGAVISSRERMEAVEEETAAKDEAEDWSSRSSSRRDRASK